MSWTPCIASGKRWDLIWKRHILTSGSRYVLEDLMLRLESSVWSRILTDGCMQSVAALCSVL